MQEMYFCVSIGKILCVWMVFPSYPLCHLADTILVRGWWSTWSIIDNGTNVLENSLLKIFTYKYKIHTYRNKHTLHTLLEHVELWILCFWIPCKQKHLEKKVSRLIEPWSGHPLQVFVFTCICICLPVCTDLYSDICKNYCVL